MTTYKISSPLWQPAPIREDRFALNGRMPAPTALNRAARSFNYVAGHGIRQLFGWAQAPGAPTDTPSSASESATTKCVLRTGENVSKLRVHVGLAPCGTSSTAPGNVRVRLFNSSDTALATKFVYYGVTSATSNYDADQIHWGFVDFAVADGVADNTQFIIGFTSNNYIRIHSIVVHEHHSTVLATNKESVANPQHWQSLKDIHYRGVQDLLESGTVLWQHNATNHIAWGIRTATPLSVAGGSGWTTAKNILDSTSTAWGANNPGYRVNCTYHDSHSGDVPFEAILYANRTAGTGTLTIDFVINGATFKSWSGIGGADPLYSTTFTHAAIDEKVDILASVSNGTTTFELYSLSLTEYEA